MNDELQTIKDEIMKPLKSESDINAYLGIKNESMDLGEILTELNELVTRINKLIVRVEKLKSNMGG